MLPPPLLARAVARHQRDLRDEVARDRQAKRAVVGTRTRGGFFRLTARTPSGTRTRTSMEPPPGPRLVRLSLRAMT